MEDNYNQDTGNAQGQQESPERVTPEDPVITEIRETMKVAQAELEARLQECSAEQRAVLQAVRERIRHDAIRNTRNTIQSLSTPV